MNKKLTLLIAIAMAGTSGAAFAQASATQSTTGSTRILQAISISKQSDLAFGSIVRSATAGTNTITIDATDGGREIDGSGGGALAAGTAFGRATYTVTGEGGQSFSITPESTFDMNRVGGGGTITVNVSASAATGALSGAIGSSGTATFGVGGNFDVSDTTATGNYTGTFNVVVAYN
jgi:Domain of unknown function (DUF4402)